MTPLPAPGSRPGLLLALLIAAASPAAAQEPAESGERAAPDPTVRTAIVSDSVRVGDVVPVAVRMTVGPGERVLWPDTLPLTGDVENAARVRERVDTLEDGRLRWTGVYSVTPWRTGELALPAIELDVVGGEERPRTLTAALPALEVTSVLPADTAGIEPRPARDVIGRNWSLWPFLLALLALAAIVAAIVWWRRRRRGETAVPLEPPVAPRERALARLQEARDAGLVDRGEMNEFYTRVAAAIREYLAAINRGWSEDLTTTELLARFRAQLGPETARSLGQVLRPADQVKFARRTPDAATALTEWEAARAWVLEFQWPPRPARAEREEAA